MLKGFDIKMEIENIGVDFDEENREKSVYGLKREGRFEGGKEKGEEECNLV